IGHINAVIPYYGYARQDRKAKPRDPISAKLVADILSAAGADDIITMDLHASQIQGYFDIPVNHLQGMPVLAKYFLDKNFASEDIVVVSPDHGSVTRARNFAHYFNCPIAIIDKRRPKPNVSEVMNIIGDVKDKICILVDDMVDTAGTITNAADALAAMGSGDVYAAATHPILSGPALDRISKSAIKEMILLNTIPIPEEKRIGKIKVLSVAPLFAETIRRVSANESISILFE
ncbi:MAG: ribose-phosphate pyrophosphokinase, partial [Firmicutes bacterium]|nr:ribose-phosphate pyrophosphokinase [Bacillota bacterium]